MDAAKTVSATFTQLEYGLTINQATGGLITAAPLPPYHLNDEVVLTATADPGYTFSAWTGACSSETTATCTLTMDAAKTVTAIFTQDEYTLTSDLGPRLGLRRSARTVPLRRRSCPDDGYG